MPSPSHLGGIPWDSLSVASDSSHDLDHMLKVRDVNLVEHLGKVMTSNRMSLRRHLHVYAGREDQLTKGDHRRVSTSMKNHSMTWATRPTCAMEIEVDEDDGPPPVSPPPVVPPSPARREDRTGERRPSNSVDGSGVLGTRGKPQKVVEKPSAETTRLCRGMISGKGDGKNGERVGVGSFTILYLGEK